MFESSIRSYKDIVENDFKLLTKKNTISFYNTAEITYIYLIKGNKFFNIYTLISFEENKSIIERHHLTDKLYSINGFSLGVSRERVNMDDAKTIFNNLILSTESKSHEWDINPGILCIDLLKILPKRFASADMLKSFPMNKVLKNNEENGSYLIEFFSEDKKILNLIDETEFKEICVIISKFIPIDLYLTNERVGNIVFQFPITIISVLISSSDDRRSLTLKIGYHPLNKKHLELHLSSFFQLDGSIIDNVEVDNINKNEIIRVNNIDGKNTAFIKDAETNLILWCFSGYFVKNIDFNTYINIHEPRTIITNDNDYQIPLKKATSKPIKYNDYLEQIINRQDRDSTKNLIKTKHFLQYGHGGINERQKAIIDLRELIKKYSVDGVYLWDPFARAKDILEVIYFSPFYNSKIKVINSFSKKTTKVYGNEKECDFETFKKSEINFLEKNSNNLGINLEIRCQTGNKGWKFHDRFLIFPDERYKEPKVWALGTSINSIGKSHSILMSVKNSLNILDAFNELWNELDHSTIWKHS